MKHKCSQVEQQKIFIRRQQVLELASDGYTERNISAQLHVPLTTYIEILHSLGVWQKRLWIVMYRTSYHFDI
jgi:ATP/maltotriose-dependent transcriptional regulator MalT